MLGNQHSHTGAFRIVILTSDIQNVCANNIDDLRQDLSQTIRTVEFINVLNVFLTLFFRFGVTNVIDVEAQSLRQVIKAVKAQLIVHVSLLRMTQTADLIRLNHTKAVRNLNPTLFQHDGG